MPSCPAAARLCAARGATTLGADVNPAGETVAAKIGGAGRWALGAADAHHHPTLDTDYQLDGGPQPVVFGEASSNPPPQPLYRPF